MIVAVPDRAASAAALSLVCIPPRPHTPPPPAITSSDGSPARAFVTSFRSEDSRGPRSGGERGRLKFGLHSAAAPYASPARHHLKRRIACTCLCNKLQIGR